MTEKETRVLDGDFSVGEDEFITGYALRFNSWSEVLGGVFKETILPEALRNTDMSNVVALLNHNEDKILGRSGANLELSVDEVGLRFKFRPTQTSYSRDLVENMKSNLINQCSFAMSDVTDEWNERGLNQPVERVIRSIGKLWDVSLVTTPAYSDTSATVSARSIEKAKEVMVTKEERKNKLRKALLESATI